jgi:Cu/Ag efflux protein CusF
MKRSVFLMVGLLIACFLMVGISVAGEKEKMVTATGKVTSVDPQGIAITISVNAGGDGMMDVGTIVDADTKVKVKGKPAALSDIKEGDTVTARYVRTDELYAKEISKK